MVGSGIPRFCQSASTFWRRASDSELFYVFAHSRKAGRALLDMLCHVHRQEIALLHKTLVLPIDMAP